MKPRKIKIVGTGSYLPKQLITSDEMDRRLGVPAGWVHKKSDFIHAILNLMKQQRRWALVLLMRH